MSCITPNCTYVTTPGYNHFQQLVLHLPTCVIAVPKDNGGPGTQGRHQELAATPPTPQGPNTPSFFDLNTSNPTHTTQKHGSEQDQKPPLIHQQAPAQATTFGLNLNCTYVTTYGFDHPQQLLVTNLGGNPSDVLVRSTLEANLDRNPTDSSPSLDHGMLQAQAQGPVTEAQLPGTGQQQAQQSSGLQARWRATGDTTTSPSLCNHVLHHSQLHRHYDPWLRPPPAASASHAHMPKLLSKGG